MAAVTAASSSSGRVIVGMEPARQVAERKARGLRAGKAYARFAPARCGAHKSSRAAARWTR
jgi:hypothetical protein